MIRAVFFDLYNTLIRYEPSREDTYAGLIKRFSPGITPAMLALPITKADDYAYGEMARGLSKRPAAEQAAIWVNYGHIILAELGIFPPENEVVQLLADFRQIKTRMVLFDDVVPALTAIRGAGLITGLVSNAEKQARDLIYNLGLTALLDYIVTSDEVGFSKPDPHIFLAALEKAKIKPAEAVYVGDQYRIDVAGARGAGMTGILLDRHGLFGEIKDCPRIRSLSEIPAVIAGL